MNLMSVCCGIDMFREFWVFWTCLVVGLGFGLFTFGQVWSASDFFWDVGFLVCAWDLSGSVGLLLLGLVGARFV